VRIELHGTRVAELPEQAAIAGGGMNSCRVGPREVRIQVAVTEPDVGRTKPNPAWLHQPCQAKSGLAAPSHAKPSPAWPDRAWLGWAG
jgi:hypothetical protein